MQIIFSILTNTLNAKCLSEEQDHIKVEQSILWVDVFEELVLEEPGRGGPGHILEQEEHAVEQLHLGVAQEADMQGNVVEADIDDLILPLLHVLHALDFVYVDADQTLLEGQVREKLHDLSQHHVTVLEDSERQVYRLLAVWVAVKHLVDPALLLPVLPVHVLALLHLDSLELLAQLLIKVNH